MAPKTAPAKKAPAKKASAKKAAAATKAPAKKAAAAKKAPVKKAPVKKAPVKKAAAAKKAPVKKAAAAKKAPAKKAPATKAAAKKASAKKATPVTTASATKAAPMTTASAKKAEPKTATKSATKTAGKTATKTATKQAAAEKPSTKLPPRIMSAKKLAAAERGAPEKLVVPAWLKDKKWLAQQRAALLEERATYTHNAESLAAEAAALMADREPGDVQFDEESGEGDTLAVERDRDLALSAKAREKVDEIDAALARLAAGTYGICISGEDIIPKERLEALVMAPKCVHHQTQMF